MSKSIRFVFVAVLCLLACAMFALMDIAGPSSKPSDTWFHVLRVQWMAESKVAAFIAALWFFCLADRASQRSKNP
jgi:hypothetical protein